YRIWAQGVLSLRQRYESLWVVTQLNRRRPLSRMAHAGIVARTAHRDRRILRQFAVQTVGRVGLTRVRRRSPRRGRQEADRACGRIGDRGREVAQREPGGIVDRRPRLEGRGGGRWHTHQLSVARG